MKKFTVTDIDGEDWSGTYEQFRAEVYRLSLPVCHHCGGRAGIDHFCAGLAKACVQSTLATLPSPPAWFGDA